MKQHASRPDDHFPVRLDNADGVRHLFFCRTTEAEAQLIAAESKAAYGDEGDWSGWLNLTTMMWRWDAPPDSGRPVTKCLPGMTCAPSWPWLFMDR